MFTKYDAKFGAVKLQRTTPTTSITGKRKQQWSWIYGSENEYTPPITPPNLASYLVNIIVSSDLTLE